MNGFQSYLMKKTILGKKKGKRGHIANHFSISKATLAFVTVTGVFRTQSNIRSKPSKVFLVKVFWKYAANLQDNTHTEV